MKKSITAMLRTLCVGLFGILVLVSCETKPVMPEEPEFIEAVVVDDERHIQVEEDFHPDDIQVVLDEDVGSEPVEVVPEEILEVIETEYPEYFETETEETVVEEEPVAEEIIEDFVAEVEEEWPIIEELAEIPEEPVQSFLMASTTGEYENKTEEVVVEEPVRVVSPPADKHNKTWVMYAVLGVLLLLILGIFMLLKMKKRSEYFEKEEEQPEYEDPLLDAILNDDLGIESLESEKNDTQRR